MTKTEIAIVLFLIAVMIGTLMWEIGKVIAVWKWIFS
jgi:hypothetical protein